MITNNSVVKIQDPIVNHESRPVKLNPAVVQALLNCKKSYLEGIPLAVIRLGVRD